MNIIKIHNKKIEINKKEIEKELPNFDNYLQFFDKYYKKYLFFNESIDILGSTNLEYTILNKKIEDEKFFRVVLYENDYFNLNLNFTGRKNKPSFIKLRFDILSCDLSTINLNLFFSGYFVVDLYIFQKFNKDVKCDIKINLNSSKISELNIIYLYYLTRNVKLNIKQKFKIQDKPKIRFCNNFYIASENNSVENKVLCLLNRGYGLFEYINEGKVIDKSSLTLNIFYNYLKSSNIEFIYKNDLHSFCEKAKIKEILYKL